MSDSDADSAPEHSEEDEGTQQPDALPTLDNEVSAAEASESDTDSDEKIIRNIRTDLSLTAPQHTEEDPSGESEDSSDESSESSDDEPPELDRLTDAMRHNHLAAFHPTAVCGEDSFVQAMTVIKRNSAGEIDDPQHRTLPFLSKYERTRVLGLRAAQIDAGSAPLVRDLAGQLTGSAIAELELKEKKMPFIVQRPMPNRRSEYWKVSDLTI